MDENYPIYRAAAAPSVTSIIDNIIEQMVEGGKDRALAHGNSGEGYTLKQLKAMAQRLGIVASRSKAALINAIFDNVNKRAEL